ncbi:MAG: isoamylase early set domain-containing protein [Gemmatimonadetes bacterium]|nr:isoamylase early set domain-containing protein [Gemmatimonadota bacterium]
MTESRDPLDSLIDTLKEPVRLSPDLTRRVMAAIVATSPTPPVEPVRWWRREWTVRVTPIRILAAAGLVGAIVASSVALRPEDTPSELGATAVANDHLTQFVLVAPEAAAVTVVGDFNDWNVSATPMARAAGDGVWSVTVPLAPGRYRYAFVINGTTWRGDPEAAALEDDFGQPSSVVTIGGA